MAPAQLLFSSPSCHPHLFFPFGTPSKSRRLYGRSPARPAGSPTPSQPLSQLPAGGSSSSRSLPDSCGAPSAARPRREAQKQTAAGRLPAARARPPPEGRREHGEDSRPRDGGGTDPAGPCLPPAPPRVTWEGRAAGPSRRPPPGWGGAGWGGPGPGSAAAKEEESGGRSWARGLPEPRQSRSAPRAAPTWTKKAAEVAVSGGGAAAPHLAAVPRRRSLAAGAPGPGLGSAAESGTCGAAPRLSFLPFRAPCPVLPGSSRARGQRRCRRPRWGSVPAAGRLGRAEGRSRGGGAPAVRPSVGRRGDNPALAPIPPGDIAALPGRSWASAGEEGEKSVYLAFVRAVKGIIMLCEGFCLCVILMEARW